MDPRRQSYWDMLDFSRGHGLEVGPLHRPMVGRDDGDVSYVDVLDRDRLLEHYAGDQNVPPDAVPEIDFFLIDHDGHTRSLAETVKSGAPFDWVMASHVIEHIPDVIGWLEELAEVVADGGSLVLAVPDRRYCFDVHRPPTTVGQMLAAHHAGDRRPPVGAVYDYYSGSVDYDVHELWRGEVPTFERRIHSLEEARTKVEATLAGEYVDSHVWLFSPESFVRQMRELRISGWSEWVVERIEPTPYADLEFRVVMRRLPRNADSRGEQAGEIQPESQSPDWLPDEAATRARIAALELANTRLERRTARLEQRLRNKTQRLHRLRRELRAQASAPQAAPGMGARVTAPARAVVGRAVSIVRKPGQD